MAIGEGGRHSYGEIDDDRLPAAATYANPRHEIGIFEAGGPWRVPCVQLLARYNAALAKPDTAPRANSMGVPRSDPTLTVGDTPGKGAAPWTSRTRTMNPKLVASDRSAENGGIGGYVPT